MKKNLQDIAKEANVSIATVSRALNNTGYVSSETKAKIEQIARAYDYVPRTGKHPRPRKSTSIGIIVPEIGNPSFIRIINAISKAVYKKGYDLLICDHQENPEHELRCITSLRSHDVCAIIIAIASNMAVYNAELLNEINKKEVPVILVDRYMRISGMDCVMADNYGGAFEAVQTLIDNGHKNIAIMCGPTTVCSGVDRLNGYIDALKKNNLPIREKNILYGDFTVESGYELMTKFLARNNRPTAIFVSSQRMTEGCLRSLRDHNISVPGDLSFIGFGREIIHDYFPDPISYVSQPIDAVGEECANLILTKLAMGSKYKKMPAKQCVFPPELKLYGSEKKVK